MWFLVFTKQKAASCSEDKYWDSRRTPLEGITDHATLRAVWKWLIHSYFAFRHSLAYIDRRKTCFNLTGEINLSFWGPHWHSAYFELRLILWPFFFRIRHHLRLSFRQPNSALLGEEKKRHLDVRKRDYFWWNLPSSYNQTRRDKPCDGQPCGGQPCDGQPCDGQPNVRRNDEQFPAFCIHCKNFITAFTKVNMRPYKMNSRNRYKILCHILKVSFNNIVICTPGST